MIREIVAHGSPLHLDELVAYLLLKRHGEEKLPGVSTASFRAFTPEDSVEKLRERQDVILLGLGTGSFDEHVFNGDKSKKEECCATLVAQFLNMEADAIWRPILNYVLHTDKNLPKLALDLASSVVRFQMQGSELSWVLQYVEITMDAMLAEQQRFFKADLAGALERGSIRREELAIGNESRWCVLMETDDPALIKQARFFGAALIIVKNPQNRQVQILSTNHLRMDMRVVARVIRMKEQQKRGAVTVADWRTLEEEGTLEKVPWWFFHKEANNLLNGGRSRPDVPATALTLDEILFAVRTALGTHFIRSREDRCQQGMCTSTRNNPCPWYAFGLPRCINIRAPKKGNGA